MATLARKEEARHFKRLLECHGIYMGPTTSKMRDRGRIDTERFVQMTEEEKEREALWHFVWVIMDEDEDSPIVKMLEEHSFDSLRDVLDTPAERMTYLPYTDERGRHKILSYRSAVTLYDGTLFLQTLHPNATHLDIMALSHNDLQKFRLKIRKKEIEAIIRGEELEHWYTLDFLSADTDEVMFGQRQEVQEIITRMQEMDRDGPFGVRNTDTQNKEEDDDFMKNCDVEINGHGANDDDDDDDDDELADLETDGHGFNDDDDDDSELAGRNKEREQQQTEKTCGRTTPTGHMPWMLSSADHKTPSNQSYGDSRGEKPGYKTREINYHELSYDDGTDGAAPCGKETSCDRGTNGERGRPPEEPTSVLDAHPFVIPDVPVNKATSLGHTDHAIDGCKDEDVPQMEYDPGSLFKAQPSIIDQPDLDGSFKHDIMLDNDSLLDRRRYIQPTRLLLGTMIQVLLRGVILFWNASRFDGFGLLGMVFLNVSASKPTDGTGSYDSPAKRNGEYTPTETPSHETDAPPSS